MGNNPNVLEEAKITSGIIYTWNATEYKQKTTNPPQSSTIRWLSKKKNYAQQKTDTKEYRLYDSIYLVLE